MFELCSQGRRRKVLMVVTSLQVGGAENQVVNLAQRLQQREWDVTVVSLIQPGALAATLAASSIPVYSLDMRRGFPDPRGMVRLARIIRKCKPDVVHSHMVHANLLARCTRLIARLPPLICTVHSAREQSEAGGSTWHKERLYGLTDPLADQTTIICQSGWDHYVSSGAAPAGRLQVVPNGIDCGRFAPDSAARLAARSEFDLADSDFVWLAAARLVPVKDFPNLLRAFAPLRGMNWKLLIAGDGPLRGQLEDLSRELGLCGQVRFLGARKDMPELYNAADAFVLSSALEGLPLTALEAQACGLPCVVTNAGGASEAVLEGVTGYVVPPRDSPALSAALNRLMSLAPGRRKQLARAARARCLATYDIDAIARRWEEIYTRYIPPASAPAKILYVITRAERGGAQIHLQDLLTNRPGECESVIITGEPGYLCDWANQQQIRTIILPSLRRQIAPLHDVRALFALIRLFRSESPALVHAHTSKAGLLCRLAGFVTRTPVLFTAHTWSFAEGNSKLQKRVAVWLERLAARCGGKIIVVSRANAESAIQNAVANPSDLVTICSAVPDVPFRAAPGMPPELKIAMIARFAPQKDHATLLKAMAKVGVNQPWKLLLVGDGPTRPETEALAQELGLGGQVDFVGDPGDIAQFLASCDLLVQATNWEGLPLSILEGMRAGLAVISTDVGGCAEAVEHGVTGFLTRKGDAADLALRIEALLASPELLQSMGAAGRARYHASFRIENMVLKTWEVYRSEVPELRFAASFERLQQRLRDANEAEVSATCSRPMILT